MNNTHQSRPSMAQANDNLNNDKTISTSLDKYAPLVDTIRGYFVQSLENRICDGLKVFLYNNDNNLATQFIPRVKKCLDIAGNAVKYFISDGIIPCVYNSIVLNNRLNKISCDLDALGMEKNLLRYVNVQNFIYANEFWIPCNNTNDNKSHSTSLKVRASYSTNYSNHVDSKHKMNKNSEQIDNAAPKNVTDVAKRKSTNSNVEHNNPQITTNNKILQMVIRNCDNKKIYHTLQLPCSDQSLIHHIAESLDSSWKNSNSNQLNDKHAASIHDMWSIINKKLDQLDTRNILRSRLYCKIQSDCIFIKLKMMNLDGSKICLFDHQICRQNNSKTKSNSIESDKSVIGRPPSVANDKPIIKRVSVEVRSERNSSARSSFRTINERPSQESPRKSNSTPPADNLIPPNPNNDDHHKDNNNDEDSSNESNYEREYENIIDVTYSSDSFGEYRDYCDSKCSCNLSGEETYYTATNRLGCELSPVHEESDSTISYKSFMNLPTSTPINNNIKTIHEQETIRLNESSLVRDSHMSVALRELLEMSLKALPRHSREVESVSMQTSYYEKSSSTLEETDDWTWCGESSTAETSRIISIVISDTTGAQEMVKIEETEQVEEIDSYEIIEEAEEGENIEKIETENVTSPCSDDKPSVFMNCLVIDFLQELHLPMDTPSSVESPENSSVTDASEETEVEAILSPAKCCQDISVSSNERNSTILPIREQCRKQSSEITKCLCSSGRHSRKSDLVPPMIKRRQKYSNDISHTGFQLNSISDVEAHCGSSAIYATGDSSMNNLYSIRRPIRQPKICLCKKYTTIKKRSNIRLNRKGNKRHSRDIKKNNKKLSVICRLFKSMFSKERFRKLKLLIKKISYKSKVERHQGTNTSKMCVCKMRHERKKLNTHYKIKRSTINLHNEHFSPCRNNYFINSEKSKYHNQSSISSNFSSSRQHKILRNNTGISTNYDSELSSWYRHCPRLSNLINHSKHREINNALFNNQKQLCQCTCYRAPIKVINYDQSADNSIVSRDNERPSFSTTCQQTSQRQPYDNSVDKKSRYAHSSSLSLSSRNSYCYSYRKILAAKKFNTHSTDDSRYIGHTSISDELDMDCGICFTRAVHDFHWIVDQYIDLFKDVGCSLINRQYPTIRNSSRTISQYK